MNVYAMYGVGGLLSISLLFSGMYSMSNIVGKVVYEKPNSQVARVVVTSVPTLNDDLEKSEPVIEEEKEEVVEEAPEEELVIAVPEAPVRAPERTPEPEPEPEPDTSENDTLLALQAQVDELLEQVAEETPTTVETSAYFVTPNGTKIDANGNIVNEDGTVEESVEDSSTSVSANTGSNVTTSSTLPVGYYRLPSGSIIGPSGEIVDEDDIAMATAQEEQVNVTSLDYFITPSGQKIDRYGNIID